MARARLLAVVAVVALAALLCVADAARSWDRLLGPGRLEYAFAGAPRVMLGTHQDVFVSDFGLYPGSPVRLAASNGVPLISFALGEGSGGIAIDGDGNLITALNLSGDRLDVVKSDALTGLEIWRHQVLVDPLYQKAYAIGVDSAGNAIVLGVSRNGFPDHLDFLAVKLAAADGAEIWHQIIPAWGVVEAIPSMVINANNDIIASVIGTGLDARRLVKLSGATGLVVWEDETPGYVTYKIAIGVSGDVFACGDADPAVTRIDIDTGAEVWSRTDLSCSNGGLALGPDESVFVGTGPAVSKLDGSSGATLWSAAQAEGYVNSIALTDGGGIFAGGAMFGQLTMIKYGPTGVPLWLYTRGDVWNDEVNEIAVDDLGSAFIVGSQVVHAGRKLAAIKLSENLSGKLLDLRSTGAAPISKLRLRSRDQGIFDPAPGSAADPTVLGGTLELRNPSSGETETFSLPASGWIARNYPGPRRNYEYRDSSGAAGSCRRVKIGTGPARTMQADCSAATFTLDEASQGAMVTTLRVGGLAYCMRFGGALTIDRVGRFRAKDAPAVAGCVGP